MDGQSRHYLLLKPADHSWADRVQAQAWAGHRGKDARDIAGALIMEISQ